MDPGRAPPGLAMIINMAVWLAHRARWLTRHSAVMLLTLTTSGLAAGLALYLAGAGGASDTAWAAVGVCGAGYALWAMAEAFARRRVGVDVIALLALAGALAVGELLAAAVISVMLASGRALEAWAAGRARRDLRALPVPAGAPDRPPVPGAGGGNSAAGCGRARRPAAGRAR
jgi:cation transport ATPase